MNTAPMLATRGLVKRFGGVLATDHADLSIATGEIHALIGPNGAGKTTLVHQLSGAIAPTAGAIVFDGRDITATAMDRRVRLGLVRSYQITSIFKRLSVLDNLALAAQALDGSSLRFWHAARRESGRYARAAQVAERIGLAGRLHALAGSISHGEQRQLELGLALALAPRLLLLDEPMAGMGPEESERMVDLLGSLRGTTTILLIEHDMDAVFRLADSISAMVSGRIVATGTPEFVRTHEQVRAAYLGDEGDGVPASAHACAATVHAHPRPAALTGGTSGAGRMATSTIANIL